jgi:tripartite-type tricarboxylate transporter receptor subunit TctC
MTKNCERERVLLARWRYVGAPSKRWYGVLIFCLSVVTFQPVAMAQFVAEFYRGKTISVVVGNSAGGGYDLNARLLARHMGRHIPGNPALIVQNMPGAGGVSAARYIYSVAPKDGSVISIFPRNMVAEPLFGTRPYDSSRFTWLGSISKDVSTCISRHASPVRTWDDLLSKQYIAATQASGSDSSTFSALLKNMFGVKIKTVSGYPGSTDMILAIERGEVDGMCGISYSTLKSTRETWLENNRVNILVQAGLEKDPALTSVPLLLDLAKTDTDRQVVKLITGTQSMARPFMTPPDIPEDRKAALRRAFDQTMTDPEFIADAAKAKLDLSPMSGVAIEALVAEIFATPSDIVQRAARALSEL